MQYNIMCGLIKVWIWDGMGNCVIERPMKDNSRFFDKGS